MTSKFIPAFVKYKRFFDWGGKLPKTQNIHKQETQQKNPKISKNLNKSPMHVMSEQKKITLPFPVIIA